MQKKVLACLLVAPMAGNAMANINIPEKDYPSNSADVAPGSDIKYEFNFGTGGNGLIAPIGAGTIKFRPVELLPGTYQLKVGGAQNLKVSVAGQSMEVADGSDVMEFTLSSTTKVAVSMSAINLDAQFQCATTSLEVVIDEAAFNAALTQLLNEAVPGGEEGITKLHSGVKDEELIAQRKTLVENYGTITGDIAKVVNPMSLEDYKTFELWKGAEDCTIGVAIAGLKTDVDKFNAEAQVANDKAQAIENSEAAYNRLMNLANGYQKALDKVLKDANDSDTKHGNNFVNSEIKEAADAFRDHISTLKAAIEAQKSNLGLGPGNVITGMEFPEGTSDASMRPEMQALQAACAKAIAENDAWANYQTAQTGLTAEYNRYYTLINSLLDAKEYEGSDVFSSARAAAIEALTVVYNKYNNSDNKLALGSTVEELNNAITVDIPSAKTQMATIGNDFQTLVTTQNTAYKTAFDAAGAFEGRIEDAQKNVTVPDAQKDYFAGLVAAANTALNAYRTYANEQYQANTLSTTSEDYTTKYNAVETAVRALEDAKADYISQDWSQLQPTLNSAIDRVQEISDALKAYLEENNQKDYIIDLRSKFDGQIAGLNAAIAALVPGTSTDAEVRAVLDAIESMVTTANALSTYYKDDVRLYLSFQTKLNEYRQFIKDKVILENDGKLVYEKSDENTGLDVLNELYNTYAEALANVGAAQAQDSFNAAKALYESFGTDDPEAQLTDKKEAFAQAATSANERYAKSVVDAANTLVKETYKDVPNLAEKAPLAALNNKYTAARAHFLMAGTDPTKLGACDDELKALVEACGTFTADVEGYVAFMNQLKDIPSKIEEANEYNKTDFVTDPAKTFFRDLLKGAGDDSYTSRYTNLVAALEDALAKGTLADEMPGDEGFTAQANQLVTDVNGVKERIRLNQEVYNDLLNQSKLVLKHLDEVIAYFKTNCTKESVLNGYLEDLNKLKTSKLDEVEGLAGVDVAMTTDFANGALNDAAKTKYNVQYKEIKEKADSLVNAFEENVGSVNNNTASGWESGISELRSFKDAAVKVYNAYLYDITNPGYHEFLIQSGLKTHEHLYAYTTDITELEGNIQAWINEKTAAGYVFSKAEFDVIAKDKMAAMKAAILLDRKALIDDVNRWGGEYWTDQSDYRGSLYTYLFNSMKGAGMFKVENGDVVYDEDKCPVLNSYLAGKCPALVKALSSWFKAQTDHQNVVDAAELNPKPEGYTYKNEIGYAMDAIADDLDKVVYDEKALEAAADLQWDALYNAFSEKAAADLASVDTAEEYSFATTEQKDAAKEAIQNEIDKAAELNSQATAEDANTLAALQDGAAATLNGYAAGIQNALDQLKNQSAANEASNELYKKYTGEDGIIPDLNDQLKALTEYAASLAADSQSGAAISSVKNAIDALSQYVETHKGDLSADASKAEASRLTTAANTAIADAYLSIRSAETDLLSGIMSQVRKAYNNVKAEVWQDKNPEAAAAWEKKVDDAIVAIAALRGLDNEEFQTAAQKLEKDLCDYLADLEALYTPGDTNTAAVDADARLDVIYQGVADALEAAKTELAACEPSVQTEFDGAYAGIESELAAVLNGYSNAGSLIVALEGNYAAQLNALAQDIAQKKSEIEAANRAALEQKAIDANAAAIQEQINTFSQQLEEIRSFLSTYQLDTPEMLGSDIQSIERMISHMQTTLNDMIAEKTLTATTVIPTEMIEMSLKNLNYNGHIAAVDYVNNLAETAVTEAYGNLSRAHLLHETYVELSGRADDDAQLREDAMAAMAAAIANYEGSAQTDEDLAKFFETFEQVITDLTKAESEARAVSEGVYENEFTPGDVDLDPDGEVTVADVQQVLTWIGEDVTYEDLVEGANPRQGYAADVNGDKTLNIADAVAILNIALEDLNNPTATPRMLAKGLQTAADNNIALALNGNENGIREYAVMINNTTEFVAGQLDLKVSSDMEIVDVELAGRGVDHELLRFDNSTGARVIIASMTNAALQGNDGAVLIVRTRGAGNLEVENAIFADGKANAFSLTSNGLSGIDGINESCQNVKERIYNVAGQTMNRIQRGINIIRKSNGKTTKEMHK